MESDNVVGVLTQADLLQGLQEHGEQIRVEDCMQRGMPNAEINEPLKDILQRLQTCQCRLLFDTGKLVGIVNMDNIMELIAILKALNEGQKQTHWQA